MLERRNTLYKADFVLSCGKRGEREAKPEALKAVQNAHYASSACLCRQLWMNEEAAQNERHKLRAYWSGESFWRKPPMAPTLLQGQEAPSHQTGLVLWSSDPSLPLPETCASVVIFLERIPSAAAVTATTTGNQCWNNPVRGYKSVCGQVAALCYVGLSIDDLLVKFRCQKTWLVPEANTSGTSGLFLAEGWRKGGETSACEELVCFLKGWGP